MTNSFIPVRRIVGAMAYVLSITTASSAATSSWIHEISGAISPSPDFRLETVTEENGHLIGRGSFRPTGYNYSAQINGAESVDRKFWPTAVADVSNHPDREWRKLDYVTSGKSASFVFSSAKANAMLYFNLDCFRPFIGQSQYGRISLPNGRVTVFALRELLPAESTTKTEPDWIVSILGGGWPDPLSSEPFYIGGIALKDGRLRVIAAYSDPSADSQTVIPGSRTYSDDGSDEVFWAGATLEVSNDPTGEWQLVGQAETPGKPGTLTIKSTQSSDVTISVCVDALRPLIAQFGYGRAVLKNGKSAAFRMKDLLPPNKRR